MRPSAAGEEIPGLTALRGVAALAVAVFHLDWMLVPSLGLGKAVPPLTHAVTAVDLFFLLSGFLMAHVYGERLAAGQGRREFLQARFARLWPLHIMTAIAMVAVVMAFGVQHHVVSFASAALILQTTLLQALWPVLNWNYPAWSISTEAIAYVAFIFAAAPLLRSDRSVAIGIATLLVAVLVGISLFKGGRITSGHQLAGLARTFACFGLGVLLFRAWAADRASVRRIAGLATVPLLAVAVIMRWDPVLIMACAGILVLSAEATGWRAALLRSRPLRALGDWSYGIYLWHAPVHFAVAAVAAEFGIQVTTIDGPPAAVVMMGTVAGVMVLAAATYRWVEVPARAALRPRRTAPTPAASIPSRLAQPGRQ